MAAFTLKWKSFSGIKTFEWNMPLPRLCQFFLRGRCQRGEKCDFSHVMPSNSSTTNTTTANGSKDQPNNSTTFKSSLTFSKEKQTFVAPKVSLK